MTETHFVLNSVLLLQFELRGEAFQQNQGKRNRLSLEQITNNKEIQRGEDNYKGMTMVYTLLTNEEMGVFDKILLATGGDEV